MDGECLSSLLRIRQGLPQKGSEDQEVYRVRCGEMSCEYEIKAYRYIERVNLLVHEGVGHQLAMRLLAEGEQKTNDEVIVTRDRKAIIVVGGGQNVPEGFTGNLGNKLATKRIGKFEQAPENTQIEACPEEHQLAIRLLPENAEVPEHAEVLQDRFSVQSGDRPLKISVGHRLSAKSGYLILPDRLVIRKPARKRRLLITVNGNQLNFGLVIQRSTNQLGVAMMNDEEEVQFRVDHGVHELAIAESELLPAGTGFVVCPELGIRILNVQSNVFVVEPGKEQLEIKAGENAPGAGENAPLMVHQLNQPNERRYWFIERGKGQEGNPITVQHSERKLAIRVLSQAPAVPEVPYLVLRRGEHQLAITVLTEHMHQPAKAFVVHPQLGIEIHDQGNEPNNIIVVQPGVNLTTGVLSAGEILPSGAGLVEWQPIQHNVQRLCLWFREGGEALAIGHVSRQLSIQVIDRDPPEYNFMLKRGEHKLAVNVLGEGLQPPPNHGFVVDAQLRIEICGNGEDNLFAIQPRVKTTILSENENPHTGGVVEWRMQPQNKVSHLWFSSLDGVQRVPAFWHSNRWLAFQAPTAAHKFVLRCGECRLAVNVAPEDHQPQPNHGFIVDDQLRIEIRGNGRRNFAIQPGVTTAIHSGDGDPATGVVVEWHMQDQNMVHRLWFRRQDEDQGMPAFWHSNRWLAFQAPTAAHKFVLRCGERRLAVNVAPEGHQPQPNHGFVVDAQLRIGIRGNGGGNFAIQPGVTTAIRSGDGDPATGVVVEWHMQVQNMVYRLWFTRQDEGQDMPAFWHSNHWLALTQAPAPTPAAPAPPPPAPSDHMFVLRHGEHRLAVDVHQAAPANARFFVHPHLEIEINQDGQGNKFAVAPGQVTAIEGPHGLAVQHNARWFWFQEDGENHVFKFRCSNNQVGIQVLDGQPEENQFVLQCGDHILKVIPADEMVPALNAFIIQPGEPGENRSFSIEVGVQGENPIDLPNQGQHLVIGMAPAEIDVGGWTQVGDQNVVHGRFAEIPDDNVLKLLSFHPGNKHFGITIPIGGENTLFVRPPAQQVQVPMP